MLFAFMHVIRKTNRELADIVQNFYQTKTKKILTLYCYHINRIFEWGKQEWYEFHKAKITTPACPIQQSY